MLVCALWAIYQYSMSLIIQFRVQGYTVMHIHMHYRQSLQKKNLPNFLKKCLQVFWVYGTSKIQKMQNIDQSWNWLTLTVVCTLSWSPLKRHMLANVVDCYMWQILFSISLMSTRNFMVAFVVSNNPYDILKWLLMRWKTMWWRFANFLQTHPTHMVLLTFLQISSKSQIGTARSPSNATRFYRNMTPSQWYRNN